MSGWRRQWTASATVNKSRLVDYLPLADCACVACMWVVYFCHLLLLECRILWLSKKNYWLFKSSFLFFFFCIPPKKNKKKNILQNERFTTLAQQKLWNRAWLSPQKVILKFVGPRACWLDILLWTPYSWQSAPNTCLDTWGVRVKVSVFRWEPDYLHAAFLTTGWCQDLSWITSVRGIEPHPVVHSVLPTCEPSAPWPASGPRSNFAWDVFQPRSSLFPNLLKSHTPRACNYCLSGCSINQSRFSDFKRTFIYLFLVLSVIFFFWPFDATTYSSITVLVFLCTFTTALGFAADFL